ncbi:hypothetical protein DXG03_006288 [Asterophora parasitica]|uniref:Uncharacterized protein n=1 Tax=Asterophora parasitica TaxID=117018 RepID=A0A9P7K8F3_9AGAR|nr:hypothetical protein DXG03_006288 [Asterophora parasitica]
MTVLNARYGLRQHVHDSQDVTLSALERVPRQLQFNGPRQVEVCTNMAGQSCVSDRIQSSEVTKQEL